MKMMRLFAALCLIGVTMAIATATVETIELGPASISLDLVGLGSYIVEKGDPSIMDHKKPDFQYYITPAGIKFDGTSSQIQIEIHQISMSEPLEGSISKKDSVSGLEHCMEKSNVVGFGDDIQTTPYSIDGKQGLLSTINGKQGLLSIINGNSGNPMYIVAYSPDMKDGSGTVVCIVASDFPWETTKSIFDSVETKLA